MTKSLSDFQRIGFHQAEIFPFLEQHGLKVGEAEAPCAPRYKNMPWKEIMSLSPFFTEEEVAAAFSGIDITSNSFLSDEEEANLSTWRTVVCRAILSTGADALVASVDECNLDGSPKSWSITPDNLAAWCAVKNHPYPLPNRQTLPSTDSGLQQALTTCMEKNALLKIKAERAESLNQTCQSLQTEIDRLGRELQKKVESEARLNQENSALNKAMIDGKARTTALKIIGGLLIKGYGINIHEPRIDGIGDVVKDLQNAGADVTEKTLRTYIKAAAEVIAPKPA